MQEGRLTHISKVTDRRKGLVLSGPLFGQKPGILIQRGFLDFDRAYCVKLYSLLENSWFPDTQYLGKGYGYLKGL